MITFEHLHQCIKNCQKAGDKKRNLDHYKTAAILIIFILNKIDGINNIILIKRNKNLRNHPGQIAFPGGKFEKRDRSLLNTAFRETEEEINLSKEDLEIIGFFPNFYTGTGYVVTPFISVVKDNFNFKQKLLADKKEVEKILLPKAEKLLMPDNHKRIKAPKGSLMEKTWRVNYQNQSIWGLTARVLITISAGLNLREFPPCDDI